MPPLPGRRKPVVGCFLAALLLLGAACQGAESVSPPEPVPTLIPVAILPSATYSATAVPTETQLPATPPTPTPDHSPTPGPSPTASATATATRIPTRTPLPSATPTSRPQIAPALLVTAPVIKEGVATPATVIPTPVPTFEVPRGTTNVLLLGSDEPLSDVGGLKSDTILIVSINRDGPTASMLSIPRDLYVYMPGRTMAKITSASQVGGVSLLKQTILYNFGIPIHYYARVDFEGFRNVVDVLGGVDIAVGCQFEDWRLISPELDIEDPDNWEVHTLEPGLYEMDGDLALWYARSRLLSSDFDRGRRQQQLLRAIFNQGVDLGMISQVPTLWSTYKENVDTDMDIGRLLQLAALAPEIRTNGIQTLYLAGKTTPWQIPLEDGNSLSAHLPIWEGNGMMEDTFARLFRPPNLSRATRPPITVEVINATGNPDMARLAADNLAWYGFAPVISDAQPESTENVATSLTYFGPNFKGSYDWLISWVMHQRQSDIVLNDEDSSDYNYRVILGADFNPCINQLFSP